MTGVFVDCNSLWHGAFSYARKVALATQNPRVNYKKLAAAMLLKPSEENTRFAYIKSIPGVDVGTFQKALVRFGFQVRLWGEDQVAKSARDLVIADIRTMPASVRVVVASQDPAYAEALAEVSQRRKSVAVACFGPLPEVYQGMTVEHVNLDEEILFQSAV